MYGWVSVVPGEDVRMETKATYGLGFAADPGVGDPLQALSFMRAKDTSRSGGVSWAK